MTGGMGHRASDDLPKPPRSIRATLEHYAAELAVLRAERESDGSAA